MLIRFTVSLMLLVFLCANTNAATSDWQDLGGGKMRLVATIDPQTNKISGAVEVKLKPGWKTYWRYPGSSGIPPRFDFSKSKGFLAGTVKFPSPSLIGYGKSAYAGYQSHVLFPFNGDMLSAANGYIKLDLLIGVCAEVCIPARASASIETKKLLTSDLTAIQLTTQANALIPKSVSAKEAGLVVSHSQPGKLQIRVQNPNTEKKPNLFVEGPSDWYLTPAFFVSQSGTELLYDLDISDIPTNTDPMATKLRFTLVSGSQGIEIQQ